MSINGSSVQPQILERGASMHERAWLNAKVCTLLVSLLCFAAAFRGAFLPIRIHGPSMEPTLQSGDYLIMKRCWSKNFRRFEVVTARMGREFITKRVIAFPGEFVRMHNGMILINGKELHEPFPVKRGSWTVKPGLIGSDEILLIGDNRELPEQSFFVVPRSAMVARGF